MFELIKLYESFLSHLNFLQIWLFAAIALFVYLLFVADKLRDIFEGISWGGRAWAAMFWVFIFFPLEYALRGLIEVFQKNGMIDPGWIGPVIQFMLDYCLILLVIALFLIGSLYFIYKNDDSSKLPLQSRKWYVVGLYFVILAFLSVLFPIVSSTLFLPFSSLDDLKGLLSSFATIGIIILALVLQFPHKKAKKKFWGLD